MPSVLIDNNTINKYNLYYLKKFLPLQENLIIGLVIKVSDDNMQKMVQYEQKNYGVGGAEYINNSKGVIAYSYVKYEGNICEIYVKTLSLFDTITALKRAVPLGTIIWSCVNITSHRDSKIYDIVKAGFKNPYIYSVSPLGKVYKSPMLCVLQTLGEKANPYILNSIEYTIKQYTKETICTVNVQYTKDTLNLLKNLCNNPTEIAGIFLVTKVTKEKNVHYLSLDDNSMFYGTEDTVDIAKGLYNFHTHSAKSYEIYKTKLGWPSAQDYVGFLSSVVKYGTIAHIVVAVEGYYMISLNKQYYRDLDDKTINFILNAYDLCDQKSLGINWYINYVNKILYNDNSLFVTSFTPYSDKNSIHKVTYNSELLCVSCFSDQETVNKFNLLYS